MLTLSAFWTQLSILFLECFHNRLLLFFCAVCNLNPEQLFLVCVQSSRFAQLAICIGTTFPLLSFRLPPPSSACPAVPVPSVSMIGRPWPQRYLGLLVCLWLLEIDATLIE